MSTRHEPQALCGLVLCGGESRRMGRDKALLTLPGDRRPLVVTVAATLGAVADPVLLASGRAGRLGIAGLREIPDGVPGAGPLAGLVAGLEASPHELVAVVAVDMPGLDPVVLRLLADLVEGHDAAVPLVDAAPEPLHAVYSRRALPALSRALAGGELALRRVLQRLDVRWVDHDEWAATGGSGAFALNLNLPHDARRWRRRAGGGGGGPGRAGSAPA